MSKYIIPFIILLASTPDAIAQTMSAYERESLALRRQELELQRQQIIEQRRVANEIGSLPMRNAQWGVFLHNGASLGRGYRPHMGVTHY